MTYALPSDEIDRTILSTEYLLRENGYEHDEDDVVKEAVILALSQGKENIRKAVEKGLITEEEGEEIYIDNNFSWMDAYENAGLIPEEEMAIMERKWDDKRRMNNYGSPFDPESDRPIRYGDGVVLFDAMRSIDWEMKRMKFSDGNGNTVEGKFGLTKEDEPEPGYFEKNSLGRKIIAGGLGFLLFGVGASLASPLAGEDGDVEPNGSAGYNSVEGNFTEGPGVVENVSEVSQVPEDNYLVPSTETTASPHDAGANSCNPDNVTVVVDAKRLRAMTLDSEAPQLYPKVLIDGRNAVWGDWVYEGPDIYFEWPVAARTVPFDPDEPVTIQIEVWQKKHLGMDKPCDISQGTSDQLAGKTVTLFYDLKRGEWTGDDYLGDGNGYGHTSGFEDADLDEKDCEIWFDIYEGGEAGWWGGTNDRLTNWEKENVYGLPASRNYDNIDFNGDGIPIWWEDKYGFDPFAEESRADEDPDHDGLTNYEEYRTSKWLSDPLAQDIFIEVDGMQAKRPGGDPYLFPEKSQQMLLNAFAKHNITTHIDQGGMGGGGDLIPFDEGMTGKELQAARMKYFLQGNPEHWRRGLFHYGLICHQMEWSGRPVGGRMCYIDMHTIGGQYVRNWAPMFRLQGSDYYTGFASVFMHELGHTLGLGSFEGADNEKARFPWNKEYWEWGPYESCMNYRYVYKLVDYSNGDDKDHDQNDWETIDLTRFTQPGW